ncbi:MAG TPA: peroxidase family protein [Solirubrobacteraceae bacterium]|nr:peroxidase family protein [Solirubrobacteraceae bacterium]
MRNAWTHKLAAASIAALIGSGLGAAGAAAAGPPPALLLVRSVDGSANNLQHPTWGKAGLAYRRVAAANYADRTSMQVAPVKPDRYVSNRIFNDLGQNLFSENHVSQWGWLWGQFIDHDLGLRVEAPGESSPLPFDQADPLERFTNDFGALGFSRTPAAPAIGTNTTRQQLNTITSYLDASMVYGSDTMRATWLRDGASLLLPNGFLPRADARGNAATAPAMDLFGAQVSTPGRAVVAGDARANENIGLTAAQTIFAREHNRVVRQLPASLATELKYQIARRVVGAEIQYITYHDFLPAMGVRLAPYTGYKPGVDPTESNEFATVGFRAHSMVHGEMEPSAPEGTWSDAQLASFAARGIVVEHDAGTVTLVVPLSLAFGAPDLLEQLGVGTLAAGLAAERQYKNDEQIDDSLRSVLFEVPKPTTVDPSACLEPVVTGACFAGVADLGADDIARGRDHGMPGYDQMRAAYGLAHRTLFDASTRAINPSDPAIMAFTALHDDEGNPVPLGSPDAQEDAVEGRRATSLASRLKAVYGRQSAVDAFTGMVSEPHPAGSEMGSLQQAMWKKQFESSRDGDRFFYLNDPALPLIQQLFGVSARHSLAEIIRANTGAAVQADVFKVPAE